MRLKMICLKKFPKTINKAIAQNVKFMRKKKRYVPPHITECFHGVVQTPGQQNEDHNCICELRHGDPIIDQKQGKELQCPPQEIHAPLINKGPMFVTNSKAEKSNYQDIACKSRRMETNINLNLKIYVKNLPEPRLRAKNIHSRKLSFLFFFIQ